MDKTKSTLDFGCNDTTGECVAKIIAFVVADCGKAAWDYDLANSLILKAPATHPPTFSTLLAIERI